MRNIKVSLSASGIDRVIEELREYKREMEAKASALVERLARDSVNIASVKLKMAQYDGDNDCRTEIVRKSGRLYSVVTKGKAVLFIEYGTGVVYPDNHPNMVFNRGAYGKGKGKNKSWVYVGNNPGSNGETLHTKKDGQLVIRTSGNPANACLYYTVSEVKNLVERYAREVFG